MSELKQAKNDVTLVGILVDKDLKIEDDTIELKEGNRKVACKTIKGTITIETGKDARNKVSLYSKSLKADGSDNGLYKGYVTAMRDFVSVAEALKKTNEDGSLYTEEQAYAEADKVELGSSSLTVDDYVKNGEVKQYTKVKPTFVQRVKDATKYTPASKFEIAGVSGGVKDEMDKTTKLPTGRKVLKLIVPVYGGKVVPMWFLAEGEIAGFVESQFVNGASVSFWGEIINKATTRVETTGGSANGGFGEKNEKVVTEYTNEFTIKGGDGLLSGANAFDLDLVKKALTEREVELEKKLKDDKDKPKTKTTNATATATTAKKFDF